MPVLAQGFLTISSPGINTFNLGITTTPTWAEVTVCERVPSDGAGHRSQGFGTATKQHCLSDFNDAIGGDSFNSSTHIVRQYGRSGGIVPVLSAKLFSLTPTGIKFDADLYNVNYPVHVRVGT